MTTGPFLVHLPPLGHLSPDTHTTQIQSITDESRSSIRRKNQASGQGTSLSRQSSLMDDTQEDEVAHFLTPPVPRCYTCSQAHLHKAATLDTQHDFIIIIIIFAKIYVYHYNFIYSRINCVKLTLLDIFNKTFAAVKTLIRPRELLLCVLPGSVS